MENKGLLFIPDISGFTRFVTDMEIEHSRHIIQQLLEVLMDANQMELEVSEVEGDAILFYHFGDPPDMKSLYAQVERMFCDFHGHLMTFDSRRLCQCKACSAAAIDLSLKVITHYGEFTGYNVRSFSKLIGKDVIVAHQLLKNDIPEHEYWLVTPGLIPNGEPAHFTEWMTWDNSIKKTETGEIPFLYTQLGKLKSGIRPKPLPALEPADMELVLSVSREYDSSPKKLFYTAGHLEFRHQWQEGVQRVEEIDHFLMGIGTRHRVVSDDGTGTVMYTSSFSLEGDDKVNLGESDEQGTRSIHYIGEKIDDQRSRFTIEIRLKPDSALIADFECDEKAAEEARLARSLERLEGLLEEIEVPEF